MIKSTSRMVLNSNYCVYLDLPDVPINLIGSIHDIVNNYDKPNDLVRPPDDNTYRARTVKKDLEDWINTVFYDKHVVHYQIISTNMPPHKDRRNTAFNYILDTGGDNVQTRFFDDDKNLLHAQIIRRHRWHRIPTHIMHDLDGISPSRVRVAITVSLNSYVWGGDLSVLYK